MYETIGALPPALVPLLACKRGFLKALVFKLLGEGSGSNLPQGAA